jgi:hypothetical protein
MLQFSLCAPSCQDRARTPGRATQIPMPSQGWRIREERRQPTPTTTMETSRPWGIGAMSGIGGPARPPRYTRICTTTLPLLSQYGSHIDYTTYLKRHSARRSSGVSKNPQVREFWQHEYEKYTDGMRADAAAPIQLDLAGIYPAEPASCLTAVEGSVCPLTRRQGGRSAVPMAGVTVTLAAAQVVEGQPRSARPGRVW